jgi:hypothetical protein
MYEIELSHYGHRGKKLFVGDGQVYYGRDEHSLIYPEGLDAMGQFPPITLADLKAVLQVGIEIGRTQCT